MRKILEAILLPLSRAVLRKHTPIVIAVAGTVGKTSTKNAIAAALSKTMTVRASEKNNNTEIGCAVTAIGAPAAGRSVLGWFRAIRQGIALLVRADRDYPAALVLEFGEERPGDLARLVELFPPKIGVVTTIGATHGATLGGAEGIAREFDAFVSALPSDGFAILSADDERVAALSTRTKAKTIRFGFSESASVRGLDPHPAIRRDDMRGLYVDGMTWKIEIGGNLIPAEVPGVLGRPPVLAALAAVAVARALGENAVRAVEGLEGYRPEKGRLRVLPGIKYSSILDDTYNASTASMIEALRALRSIPLDEGEERFAVLGEMRQMGAASEEEHRKVGRAVVEFEVDRLFTVGEMARDIMRGAREAGMPEEHCLHFSGTEEAGKAVQGILERGDIVLVKGSRGTHMEAVVKELMAEPMRAEELLEWGEPTT